VYSSSSSLDREFILQREATLRVLDRLQLPPHPPAAFLRAE
jgi:hypothetical protein